VIPDEHREFIASHRYAVVGTNRTSGPPALSPVFYVVDGDDILISITTERHKYRALTRDPQVSLCIIHEEMPFPYMTVYGTARFDEDAAAAAGAMVAVSESMLGRPMTDEERAAIDQRVVAEKRVVLRVTVDQVIEQAALRRRFSR
jgi:PPOX class probable F420-dependent enzyme